MNAILIYNNTRVFLQPRVLIFNNPSQGSQIQSDGESSCFDHSIACLNTIASDRWPVRAPITTL